MFKMFHMLVMTFIKIEFLHIHNWSQIMHLLYLKGQEAGLMTCVPTDDKARTYQKSLKPHIFLISATDITAGSLFKRIEKYILNTD